MLQKRELNKFNKALQGKQYDRLPIMFNALGDPTRCKIARLLINKGDRKISINDISEIVSISQSSASQHVKILEITGIAHKVSAGRSRYVELNSDDPIVKALARAIT